MKRVVVISDNHAGHFSGLAPNTWQFHPAHKELQSLLWSWYVETLKSLQPIDILLHGGDATDGKGIRSGGSELIAPDWKDQQAIAVEVIREARAKKIIMVHGTPYHTASGDGIDIDNDIAREVGAEISGHQWIDVNGVMFDLKHKVGSSSVPYGRHTAVAKERVWNLLWNEQGANPKSAVILRGHVHFHTFQGDCDWMGMTLPALQGPGSKYGVRQCSGIVNFGLVSFDVSEKGVYSWKPHILKIKDIAKPIKC